MGTLSEFFGFAGNDATTPQDELPNIYPIGILESLFIETDLINLYSKILTDVLERTEGYPEGIIPVLWDNCLQSESSEGLVTLLSKAMSSKADLFLVYKADLGVLRKADNEEVQKIREDYKKLGKSNIGVYLSFKNYNRSDMIKFYSALEYSTVGALYKSMNLSKAIQIKVNQLRAGVSLGDSAEAKAQGLKIAQGLAKGKDVLLDSEDTIETSKPDLTATKEAMLLTDAKRCFYSGMPLSYVNGEQTTGIGSTGEADTRATERGLKNYYFSIIRPVMEALFEAKTTFKTEDFRLLTPGLEALKTFELVGDEFMSPENKLLIINRLFGVDSELGEAPEPAPVIVAPDKAAPKQVPGGNNE